MHPSSAFSPGSLVALRGREWIVQPNPDPDTLLLRPLGGTDADLLETSPSLEKVSPAEFSLPDPAFAGDAQSCALLRDAVRLGLRATTGPYRCFGNIAVEPRPYQLVPLLMAMRQETVRLLIADDVGIGKTVEALLIGRELLERGEIRRIAVICPAPLVEQWQSEMRSKFGLDAVAVLPRTAARLERDLPPGKSLFDKYPVTVISLDFIKPDFRREDFARACPEFVIVDEAHTCAAPGGRRGRQQRHALISELARDRNRHMLFVTATPHSGNEDAFRSLLAFLNEDFSNFDPETGDKRRLAAYFIQRRRGDIQPSENSPFPLRKTAELTWTASADWQRLFDATLSLCRENLTRHQSAEKWQMHWWASLIMLRALSSSPAAALEAFSHRVETAEDGVNFEASASQSVYDSDGSDDLLLSDSLPGANTSEEGGGRRFRELIGACKRLRGSGDPKLSQLIPELVKLLDAGYSPVIFCRFIPTATYLAEQLAGSLLNTKVAAITGLMEPAEREIAVKNIASHERRVLVATDCLSEGINLQSAFNAVIHYDLSWNPGRHEQREGRVDRFGQAAREVRAITWWGRDNPMDGMVLDVLLRKHIAIRSALGISVPVPAQSEEVMATLLKGLILRDKSATSQDTLMLPHIGDWLNREKNALASEWDKISAREARRSRSLFRQSAIRPEQAAAIAQEMHNSLGDSQTTRNFVITAWRLLGGRVSSRKTGSREIITASFDEIAALRHPGLRLPEKTARYCFDLPAGNAVYLHRTHPLVESVASYLAQTSLDDRERLLPRCGVTRANAVAKRAHVLLCRFRFLISGNNRDFLAEECLALGFQGQQRLAGEATAKLLDCEAAANCDGEEMRYWLAKAIAALPDLAPTLGAIQEERAQVLLASHKKGRGGKWLVKSQGKPDIIGVYVYLPAGIAP